MAQKRKRGNGYGADAILRAAIHTSEQGEPVRSGPVRAELVQIDPLELHPVQGEPVQVDPLELHPVRGDPVQVDPLELHPVQGEPVQVDPLALHPVQGEPVQVDPLALHPVQGEPVQVDPLALHPVQGEPVQVNPVHLYPVPGQPVHVELRRLDRDEVQQWIYANWTQLAAKAYWGYIQSSMGCLFVFVRSQLPERVDWDKLTGVYMPVLGIVDLSLDSEIVPNEIAMQIMNAFVDFNFERQIVICVANPGWTQWEVFRLEHPRITPQEAYNEVGAQFAADSPPGTLPT